MNQIIFKLGTYEVGIYRNSVIQRHNYQLTSGIIETRTAEIGVLQSLRETSRNLFKVIDILSGVYYYSLIHRQVISAQKWYTRV